MAKKHTKAKKKPPSKPAKPEGNLVRTELANLPVFADPRLKLTWVDRMTIAVRTDIPVATLSFFSVVGGDRLLEAAHLETSVSHLKSMVDVIARQIDYYPQKPK